MRYEVGVGGLILVAVGMAGLMAADVGSLGMTDTVDVTVPMVDATGLEEGADVKVAGVAVGTVGSMFLAGDHAMVTLRLDPDAKLRHNVQARVRMESLFGSKYVELALVEAQDDAPLLTDGDVLPPAGEHLDADELIDMLGALLAAIDPEELGKGLEGLTRALHEDPERIGRILDNLDQATQNAALASQDLPALTGDVRITLATTRSTLRKMDTRSTEAGYVLARADRVLAHLEASAAPLPDAILEAQRVLSEARDTAARIDAAATAVERSVGEVDLEEVEALLREEGIRVRVARGRR